MIKTNVSAVRQTERLHGKIIFSPSRDGLLDREQINQLTDKM